MNNSMSLNISNMFTDLSLFNDAESWYGFWLGFTRSTETQIR